MLKNAPTLAIVAVDTAENEPPKALKKFLFKTRQIESQDKLRGRTRINASSMLNLESLIARIEMR